MKSKTLTTIVITILALFVFSCKDEDVPTETIEPKLLRVIGEYVAIKYITSDPLDNHVDILKIGGSVTAEITKSATIKGRIIVPKEFYKGFSGADFLYSGTVEFIGNDTIKFNDTKCDLSILKYRAEGDSLKAEASTVGYFAMTLKKIKGNK